MIRAVVTACGVRPLTVATALALTACTVGDGSDNASSFGMTSTPATVSSTASTASATEVEDDDSGSADTMSSGEPDTTSDATSSPTSGTSEPTSSSPTSADTGTEQPEDGMYSPCVSAVDCIGLTACEQGFCTRSCMDTSVCDPTPGGTAAPTCFMFDTGLKCALSCNSGTCPTPMQCTALATGSVCTS